MLRFTAFALGVTLALALVPKVRADDWEDYWEDYRERLKERREGYEDWLEEQGERREDERRRWRRYPDRVYHVPHFRRPAFPRHRYYSAVPHGHGVYRWHPAPYRGLSIRVPFFRFSIGW